jgi:hypothetical protein
MHSQYDRLGAVERIDATGPELSSTPPQIFSLPKIPFLVPSVFVHAKPVSNFPNTVFSAMYIYLAPQNMIGLLRQ